MDVNTIDLNNINVDEDLFEDDPETIVYVTLMAWYNKYKQHESWKKGTSKEITLASYDPTRWWDWCMPKYEKKNLRLMKSTIMLVSRKIAFSLCWI